MGALTSNPLLLAVLVGGGVFAAVLILWNKTQKGYRLNRKVQKLKDSSEELHSEFQQEEYLDFHLDDENKSDLAVALESVLRLVGVRPEKYQPQLNLQFAQAGIYSSSAPVYYLFAKKFGWLVMLPLAALFLLGMEPGTKMLVNLFAIIILLFLGIAGADVYLKNLKQKRQVVLMRAFPDALDLILVCVEAGLSLDAALARVCSELKLAHPEITKEINKTRMELTLLNDRPEALRRLAARTDLVAFRQLVSSLLQSEKFGTSLAETLRVLSEDFRHTRLMLAEEKANKLPALITFPMILFLIPALFMIILGPAFITVYQVWPR